MPDEPTVTLHAHFDERIGTLERGVDERIRTLEHDIERRAIRLEEKQTEAVARMEQRIVDASRTPWGMVGVLIALFVAVAGGYWVLVSSEFTIASTDIKALRDDLKAVAVEAVRKNELAATTASVDKDFVRVNTQIQRLLDREIRGESTLVSRVELNALEKRLDEKNKTQDTRMDGLLSKDTWMAHRTERDRLLDGYAIRLRHLETTK